MSDQQFLPHISTSSFYYLKLILFLFLLLIFGHLKGKKFPKLGRSNETKFTCPITAHTFSLPSTFLAHGNRINRISSPSASILTCFSSYF
jgi:hypothetical protein